MFFSSPAFLAPLVRTSAFFLFSPALSKFPLPFYAKGAFIGALTLFSASLDTKPQAPLAIFLMIEFLIGYLLGTLFAFILESIEVTAALLSKLGGFSLSALFIEEESSQRSPLIFLAFILFFSLDLHHLLVRLLLSSSNLSLLVPHTMTSLSEVFKAGFLLSALPLLLLGALALFVSVIPKIDSQFPLFWTLLPIQFFVGILSVILVLTRIPQHLKFVWTVFFHP